MGSGGIWKGGVEREKDGRRRQSEWGGREGRVESASKAGSGRESEWGRGSGSDLRSPEGAIYHVIILHLPPHHCPPR